MQKFREWYSALQRGGGVQPFLSLKLIRVLGLIVEVVVMGKGE